MVVEFQEWCRHLPSDFMISMTVIANNHEMPGGSVCIGGGVVACIHTILSETELKGSSETQHLKANMPVWAH